MLVLAVGRFEELWAFGGVWGFSFSLTYFVPLNGRRLVPIRVINSEPYTQDDIVPYTEWTVRS